MLPEVCGLSNHDPLHRGQPRAHPAVIDGLAAGQTTLHRAVQTEEQHCQEKKPKVTHICNMRFGRGIVNR